MRRSFETLLALLLVLGLVAAACGQEEPPSEAGSPEAGGTITDQR